MIEIQMLDIAQGIRDHLITSGLTVDAILKMSPSELSSTLGVELYVARIIIDAAKKAAGLPAFDEHSMQMLTE
jgi:hypothetical protein